MVTLDDGVHHVWANYNRALSYTLLDDTLDGRLYGSYGRLPVQALKIATILAAMDWPAKAPAPRIEMRHLGRALDVTESWRAAAHRVLTMTTDAQEETTSEKVLKYVARAGEQGATLRELYRPLNMSAGECELALRDLLRTGEVEIMTQQKGRGRPTKRYRLVKNVT
jgi:predicted transcriptional regulator